MSDQPKEENNEAPDGEETVDPYGPTQVDPKRAFEMGAETPDAHAVPAHWSPPEPEVLDPLFPDYDLLELIGRGGMGAVYRGVQLSLDRPVAIKVLPPEMAEADPSFAARFEREAKSMARLDHPNIVHVYDFGRTEAGHWFIVMEFVDGMDFHQLIRSGTLDSTGALNAVSQICDALEYAHAQGYVHRDIKPANIFINQSGTLKVGDFGLAKMIEGETGETTIREPQPMLTQTGISMGTPDYCSPEQLEGRHIDHRADIYSLGVMFYEMLTRELPRGNFPPPSKKVQVDVRIDDVVLRAMESEPEMRYSTAGEMRTEVDAVRTGPSIAADAGLAKDPTSNSPKRQSWIEDPSQRLRVQQVLILVAVLLFCVAAFFIWRASGKRLKAAELNLGAAIEAEKPAKADKNVRPPWAGTKSDPAHYGLPAFHGELRPIPGTAGWRSEVPGELVAIPIVPGADAATAQNITLLPPNLENVVSICMQSRHYGFAILEDGTARAWGPDSELMRQFPRDLEEVVAIDADGNGTRGIALHRNGSVTPWGTGRSVQQVRFQNPQEIVSVCAVAGFGFLLANADGELLEFFDENLSGRTPILKNIRAVVAYSTNVIVIHQDGSLTPIRYDLEKSFNWLKFPPDIPSVAVVTQVVGALLEDGRAVEWDEQGEGRVLAERADMLALNSVIRLVHVPGEGWVVGNEGYQHKEFAEAALRECSLIFNGYGEKDWVIAIRPPSRPAISELLSAHQATATKDTPFTNSLGMQFVPVPVPVPNGPTGGKRVLFSRWETRVSDYRAFADATNSDWPAPEFEQGDDHPAVNVSWEDAVAFCEWLTERERESGTIGSNERYRLPSDHEWSCAVEIGHLEDPDASPISKSPPKMDRPPPGTDTAVKGYPMGDKVYGGFSNAAGEETKAAGLSNNIVHGMKDGYAATAPVGNYKPNRFGLFDISGNVWEWCEDAIDPDSRFTRVRRGACWKTVFIPEMRSARREGAAQDTRSDLNGFRCVLSSE